MENNVMEMEYYEDIIDSCNKKIDNLQDKLHKLNIQIEQLKKENKQLKGEWEWSAKDWEAWARMELRDNPVAQLPTWYKKFNRT